MWQLGSRKTMQRLIIQSLYVNGPFPLFEQVRHKKNWVNKQSRMWDWREFEFSANQTTLPRRFAPHFQLLKAFLQELWRQRAIKPRQQRDNAEHNRLIKLFLSAVISQNVLELRDNDSTLDSDSLCCTTPIQKILRDKLSSSGFFAIMAAKNSPSPPLSEIRMTCIIHQPEVRHKDDGDDVRH